MENVMENTYEVIEKIMNLYYEKDKENKELFNKKENDTIRLNKELSEFQDKKMKRIDFLTRKLQDLDKEKESAINKYFQSELEAGQQQSVNVNVNQDVKEQQYQQQIAQIDSKLNEISSKEEKRNELMKKIADYKAHKNDRYQIYLSSCSVNRQISQVELEALKTKFMAKDKKELMDMLENLYSLTEELMEKNALESQLNAIKLERKKEFGENVPTGFELHKAEYHEQKIRAMFDKEYDNQKKLIMNELAELENESDFEKKLKEELNSVATMPNYNNVYLKEMFDFKYEARKILGKAKTKIECELAEKNMEKSDILDGVSSELKNKYLKRDDIANEFVNLPNQLDDNKNPINEEERNKLKNQLSQIQLEIAEIEKIHGEAVLEANKVSKVIDNLNKLMEIINKSLNAIQPNSGEIAAFTTMLTTEEEQEYNRRKDINKKFDISEDQFLLDGDNVTFTGGGTVKF